VFFTSFQHVSAQWTPTPLKLIQVVSAAPTKQPVTWLIPSDSPCASTCTEERESASLSDSSVWWCSWAGWKIVLRPISSDKIDRGIRLFHEHVSGGARSGQFGVSVDDRGAAGSAHQRHAVQLRRYSIGRRRQPATGGLTRYPAARLRPASTWRVLRDRSVERRQDKETGDGLWRRGPSSCAAVEWKQRRQHRDAEPDASSKPRHLRIPLSR